MKHKRLGTLAASAALCSALAAMTAAPARAQDTQDNSGYSISEITEPAPSPNEASDQQSNTNSGPVRLARFAYVHGNVTWRADENQEWSQATGNLPIRQGAQIWVNDGGRAEVQFDDGSTLRLGNGALATLQTLYSDADGEFSEIKLNAGLASMRVKHSHSIYQIDTPLTALKAKGPAKFRIGVGDGVEIAIHSGNATVEGDAGKAELRSGDFLDMRDANSPYDVHSIPAADNWDRWNDDRDNIGTGSNSQRYLPENIAIVAGDLDSSGSWHDDGEYGHVWSPRVSDSNWRPYHDGHWTWVNPFGWTWVADESWGWAPYHYGTWVNRPYGWAWCPGPVNQYWSPAVVHFSEYGGQTAWCALAPSEVRYPSILSIGFRSGNWSALFSIGQAAVYYPYSQDYCRAQPFNTTYVNQVTNINNVTVINNTYNNNMNNNNTFNRYNNSAEYYAINRSAYANSRFVPINARNAAGTSIVATTAFAGRAAYLKVPRASTDVFTRGRSAALPVGRFAPVSGPIAARPNAQSLTPTRAFTRSAVPAPAMLNRAVFRAPLAPAIVRSIPAGAGQSRTMPVVTRPARGTTFTRPDRAAAADGNRNANGRTPNTANMGRGTNPVAGITHTGSSSSTNNGMARTGRDTTVTTRPGRNPGGTSTGNPGADAAARARASLGVGGRNTRTGGSTSATNSGGRSSDHTTNGGTTRTRGNGGTAPTTPRNNGGFGTTTRGNNNGAGSTNSRTNSDNSGTTTRDNNSGMSGGYRYHDTRRTPPPSTGTSRTNGSGSDAKTNPTPPRRDRTSGSGSSAAPSAAPRAHTDTSTPPRRESTAPAPRRESTAPAPRRESPPRQQPAAPPRRESPPPRQEAPHRDNPPARQAPAHKADPPAKDKSGDKSDDTNGRGRGR